MRLNLTDYYSKGLRAKLAEVIVSTTLKGILTTKYPPEILETEFFDELSQEHKDFLKKYWSSFDIFKPIFEIINEKTNYKDFILYEVKSKLITEKNQKELEAPIVRVSVNQKRFLEECKELNIPIKFFLVFFLKNWEVEYNIFDCDKVSLDVRLSSAWQEEKMKRIRSSKLNQFWHDLFPNYVLYKISEEDLERENEKQLNDYVQEKIGTPLQDFEKDMLIERAIKRNKPIPKFAGDIEKDAQRQGVRRKGRQVSIRTNYYKRLEEIKKTFPNAYRPWGQAEDNRLRDLFSKNRNIREISQILKRQPSAIRSRLRKLSLIS